MKENRNMMKIHQELNKRNKKLI